MSAQALQRLDFIVGLIDKVSGPANKMMKTMDTVSTNVKGGFTQIGVGAAGLIGVGFAVDRLIDKAVRFESVMADVNKTVNFDSPQGLADFSQDILKLTKNLPITAEGLGEIAAAGGRLGLDKGQLPAFVDVTAKMATAFDLQTDIAGDYAANLSNIYSIPIDKLSLLGDTVNHLSDNTAAKAGDIIDVLQRTGGTGQQFGLASNEIAAMAASMLALGLPSEKVGTSMDQLFIKLLSIDQAGPKVQKALDKVGISSKTLASDIAANPQAALSGFLEQINGLSGKQGLNALTAIVGVNHAPKLALLAGGYDKYAHTLGLVADQQKIVGSMEKEFQIRSNTTANKLVLLGNGWNRLMIGFGSILLPVVINGIGMLNSVMDPVSEKIAKWNKLFPTLTSWIGNLVGFVVGVTAVIASLSIVLGISKLVMAGWKVGAVATSFVMGPITALLKAMRWGWLVFNSSLAAGSTVLAAVRVAMIATWTVMAANPIGVVIAGVALLAFGLLKLADYFGVFDFLKEKIVALKSFFDNFNLFESLIAGLDWLINKINLIPGIDISSIGGGSEGIAAPQGITPNRTNSVRGGGLVNRVSNATANTNRSIGEVNIFNSGQAMGGQDFINELDFLAG